MKLFNGLVYSNERKRKLPELGKGLGQGLANFRRAVREPGKNPSENGGGPKAPENDKASSEEKTDRPN